MTPLQKKLFELADKIHRQTFGAYLRHPNRKIEWSREWALCEAYGAAHGQMPDDETCQKLIEAIND